MKFRPCIDIHNGKVKQIVGGSLRDEGDSAKENFISEQSAADFAGMYRKDGLQGGHVILLNAATSEYYEQTKEQAIRALKAYSQGLQVGGGINADNAKEFLDAGASHVIVTSYIFKDGKILWENLEKLRETVGKERIVIDLSCRKKDGKYYIVTDRWQKFTEEELSEHILKKLEDYCDEYLIHGVDVEGHAAGVDETLAKLLASYTGNSMTYAGGIGTEADLEQFARLTDHKIDFTIGSALDIFGGKLKYEKVKNLYKL